MDFRRFALLSLALALVAPTAAPQTTATPVAASAPTAVPSLVPYAGAAIGSDGKPLGHGQGGETGVTFQIYKDEVGGEALWTESQTVAFDGTGHYKVQLGAANPNGLPSDLFATGEARWLEVQVAGETPQPRVLLASVPYALKAGDATTLGGLPASAFALAGAKAASAGVSAQGVTPDSASNVTTTGGTAGYLPEFSGAATIVDSPVFVSGSNVGIGTATPSQTLDVNGTTVFRSSVYVYHNGTATPSGGVNSVPMVFLTEAYDSSTKAVVAPAFQWKAEVGGNNTASPFATQNLLYSDETGTVETGFHFNPDGTLNFAPGQTFFSTSTSGAAVSGYSSLSPGVQGSSYAGQGVSGSSTNGSGVVGTAINGAANTAGVYGVAVSGSGIGAGTIAGVWGDSMSHVGVAGTSLNFPGVTGLSSTNYGVQGTSTSSAGVEGSSSTSDGVVGATTGPSTANTAGVYGVATPASGIGAGTIAGVWGDAKSHVGVAGTSATSAGVQGTSSQGNGVVGTATNPAANTAGVYGVSASGSGIAAGTIAGVWGDANVHVGVAGTSASNFGVQGTSYSSYGVQGTSATSAGVQGNSSLANGVEGTSSEGYGVRGSSISTSTGSGVYGVVGSASGILGSAGVWGDATDRPGVFGTSTATGVEGESNSGTGVLGDSYSSIGVYGFSSTGLAVNGVEGNRSNEGGLVTYVAAIWADTGITGNAASIDTADEGFAGLFYNSSSSHQTVYAENDAKTSSSAKVFQAVGGGGFGGTCTIDVSGNLTCNGAISGSEKNFRIDDPLDPANKTLVHASVESSERMNIYTGNVTTDELGLATITLPEWFESLNTDFRYQLTTIGRDAHAWVAKEVANGKFQIATNATNVKVSWQITAVRQDAYAKANPMVVEQEKPAAERGHYIRPELYGQPLDKQIGWELRPQQKQSQTKP